MLSAQRRLLRKQTWFWNARTRQTTALSAAPRPGLAAGSDPPQSPQPRSQSRSALRQNDGAVAGSAEAQACPGILGNRLTVMNPGLEPPQPAAPRRRQRPAVCRGREEQTLDSPSRLHELRGTEANFRAALRVSDPEAVTALPEPRAAAAGSNRSRSSGRDRGRTASLRTPKPRAPLPSVARHKGAWQGILHLLE